MMCIARLCVVRKPHQILWTLCLLVGLVLGVGSVSPANGQTPTNAFTQPFNWATNKISILPASNWGLFNAGDTVSISTSDNSPVTIFNLYGQTVYSGAPTSMNFAVGHYFIQCNGDRNQFAVR